jgi:hypothetical protein
VTVKVVTIDDGCDVCGRAGVIGVLWRRAHRDDLNDGRVAVLCHECVLEGGTALASYGNQQVPPAEKN